MPGNIVAPRRRDLDELALQLSGWLAGKLAADGPVRIGELSYPSGAGMSHETILFDAIWDERGRAVHEDLVVRVKPSANMVFPDDLFDEQYRIMRYLFETGHIPVAEPLWFEAADDVIGAPFFVMRRMRGRVPVSRPPYAREGWLAEATPAQRRRLWENGVRVLASVATAPTAALGFLEGPDEDAQRGLEQEWAKYMRFVEWVSEDRRWPVLDAAVAALRERWPANRPEGLVWGGAEMVNMMFDEDFEVVGVMDWEQPSLGGPLNDLAWWLYMAEMKHGATSGNPPLAGMGSRDETIALWGELAGLPTADIDWYEDFMALKIACLGMRMARLWNAPPPDHSRLAKRLNLPVG